MNKKVAAIVVTFNRITLLKDALKLCANNHMLIFQ